MLDVVKIRTWTLAATAQCPGAYTVMAINAGGFESKIRKLKLKSENWK